MNADTQTPNSTTEAPRRIMKSFMIDKELAEDLKAESKQTGIPETRIIDRALRRRERLTVTTAPAKQEQ